MTAAPTPPPRNVLTPEALTMMDAIARSGSFAAAARALGKVPSALTYNVRQLEDALDVLLFDRRSRQATLTAAGRELLDEGRHLLEQMDAVASRVKRIATGWESQLGIAVDDVISRSTMLDLCSAFYAECAVQARAARSSASASTASASASGPRPQLALAASAPPTRLRLRTEVMTGTWEALVTGQADLAVGVGIGREVPSGVAIKELGTLAFCFAVAPHHPLALAKEPLSDAEIVRHRAVAVADSAHRLAPLTFNLLPGQDVLTVSDMLAKIDALVRGVGCGFVPAAMAREAIAGGRLIAKQVQRAQPTARLGYAWRLPVRREGAARKAEPGLALRWWLERLEGATTRRALLDRHGSAGAIAEVGAA
ncbi:MAG: LysR substrate-binding domain-containing protein [Caldimonas sp.]